MQLRCWFLGREENRRTRRKTLEAPGEKPSKHRRDQLRQLYSWVPSLRFSTDGHPCSYWPRLTGLLELNGERQRANRVRHPSHLPFAEMSCMPIRHHNHQYLLLLLYSYELQYITSIRRKGDFKKGKCYEEEGIFKKGKFYGEGGILRRRENFMKGDFKKKRGGGILRGRRDFKKKGKF